MAAFWTLARRMSLDWPMLLLALVMVIISGVLLGVGLLAALPVIESILGKSQGLPQLATRLNETLVARGLGLVQVPDSTIAMLPADPFISLAWIMSTVAILTVFGSAATFLHAYLSQTVVNRAVTRLRREAFSAALRAPLRLVMSGGPSDAISRIVNDSAQVTNGLTVLLSKAVLQVAKGITAVVVALVLNPTVALSALLLTPVLYTVIRKLGKRIKRASGRALEGQAQLYAAANQSLSSLRVVKAHTSERYEAARFHRVNKQMLRELNRVRTARALASPLTESLTIFVLCGIVLVVGRAIVSGRIAAAEFVLAIGALAVAGASLKPLTGIINDIQTSAPAAKRLLDLMHAAPEPGHDRGLERLPRHARSIEFRDVSYTYEGAPRPAVASVSLVVAHGSRVAFVGPNGCGKTTLLSLVPRLLEAGTGEVLIDGVPISRVSVRSLRRQIGVVTQDAVLFAGSIGENIAYGTPATRAEVESAAQKARAHDFIMAMSSGYDSILAEGGVGLSGGQRQRLAIARAILRDPAILILDEATSMIDADSEAQISAALAEFSKGRTCLIVAHRLSTVVSCDQIVVMDQGRIVGVGTHAELNAKCPTYQQLARHQFAATDAA
jgi:ABC-type multidrug transport system fused ATPase/permease subunit